MDQLLVTWVVLPFLSGDLPDCFGDLLSGSVASPICWEAFWHLNDHVWGTGRVCCRLDRVSPASDFQENGLHHILTTLQFPAREAVIAFFWFPVRILSWLFGAITGTVMVLISRRFGTHWLGSS